MAEMPRSTAMQLTPVVFAPPTPPTPTPTPPSPVLSPAPPVPPRHRTTLTAVDAATQTRRVPRPARLPRLPRLPSRRPLARTMPLAGFARSAEDACRTVDDSARLAFVSQLHDRTMLRLRSAKPLDELKASLTARFPLARVRTYSDCLDGSAGAELELPGEDEAFVIARDRVRARPLLRALRRLSQLCLIMAVFIHLSRVYA